MARPQASRRRRIGFGLETLEGRVLLSAVTMAPRPQRAAEIVALHRNAAPTPAPTPTSARWAWLENTVWYVPTPNLPATIFDPGTGLIIPALDQTVYHITGYKNGYFWGETVTQLGQGGTPSSSALVGSVTPQGRLLLSFTSSGGVIQGYGTMTRMQGRWTMENQMFTTTSTGVQIGHWAYMVPTRPGMRSWDALPLVGVSVPTFLGYYSAPSPTPIAPG